MSVNNPFGKVSFGAHVVKDAHVPRFVPWQQVIVQDLKRLPRQVCVAFVQNEKRVRAATIMKRRLFGRVFWPLGWKRRHRRNEPPWHNPSALPRGLDASCCGLFYQRKCFPWRTREKSSWRTKWKNWEKLQSKWYETQILIVMCVCVCSCLALWICAVLLVYFVYISWRGSLHYHRIDVTPLFFVCRVCSSRASSSTSCKSATSSCSRSSPTSSSRSLVSTGGRGSCLCCAAQSCR